MPAGATYEPIATASGTGSSGSITFSSIPSTYTDLIIIANAASVSGTYNALIRFNGDTGSNYSRTALTYDGGSVISSRNTNQTFIVATVDGIVAPTTPSPKIVHIENYSDSVTYKTILGRDGNTAYGVATVVGLWRSTSAITSIEYFISGGNFTTTSTFTLYGIKAA